MNLDFVEKMDITRIVKRLNIVPRDIPRDIPNLIIPFGLKTQVDFTFSRKSDVILGVCAVNTSVNVTHKH